MDKTIVMGLMTALGIFGSLGFGPYIGVIVYYFFAIARPQIMWAYALPKFDFGWSYWVAIAVMASTVIGRAGFVKYPSYGPSLGARPPRWNFLHLVMIVFAFWQTMSYVLSENPKYAFPPFLEYVKIFAMFIVASYALARTSQLWFLLAAITLADIYVAYEMNFIYFVMGRNDLQRSGFGGLDNNGAGLLIAMGIPLCYFLWESTRSHFRWVYILGIPVIGHAVMLSFSRGALLSVGVVAPLLFVLSRKKGWVAFVYIAGAAFVLATSGPELRDRFFSISKHEDDGSAQERFRTWATAIKLANDKPLFGYGTRCSTLHTKEVNGVENQAIHNTYLQMAADSGWPAMALYLALTGGAITLASRFWWQTRTWPMVPSVVRARAVAVMVITSLAIYCIGAIFLSLETSELSYILVLISAQLWSIHRCGGVEAVARTEVQPLPPPRPMFRPRRPAVPPAIPPDAVGAAIPKAAIDAV